MARDTPRYFWSEWFTGQSPSLLGGIFVLLSLADLIATLRLIEFGVQEANILADTVLALYGPVGMGVYKLALVMVVLAVTRIIAQHDHGRACAILWFAMLLMGYVALWHLSMMVSLTL